MEHSEPTYAIVLSGDVEPNNGPVASNQENHTDEKAELHDAGQTGGRGGGRMQRVGDKWMFVRDVESGTP